MRLLSLSLINFKGALDVKIEPDGENLNIYGDNATGKTTIADAWFWLLFGKDSHNQADFEIKTLDKNGKPLQGIEHSVHGELEIGGKVLTLTRTYKETWTKKRGSAESEMTGHTTEYRINSVPVQKNEYDAKIKEICDERTFRLLTDPMYFCGDAMKWQDRRAMLLALTGEPDFADVIDQDAQLIGFSKILNGNSIEDHRKIVGSQKKAINQSLESIPARIDEAKRSANLPSAPAKSLASVRNELAMIGEDRKLIDAGGELNTLRLRRQDIEVKLGEVRLRVQRENGDGQGKLIQQRNELQRQLGEKQQALLKRESDIAGATSRIQQLSSQRDELREQYVRKNEEVFVFGESMTCATCGQALPAGDVEAMKARAEEAFNLAKSNRLEAIKRDGIQAKEAQEALEVKVEVATRQVAEFKEAIAALEAQIETLNTQIQDQVTNVAKVENDPEFIELRNDLSAIETQIKTLNEGNSTALADLNSREAQLTAVEQEWSNWNALKAVADGVEARVEELMAEKLKLSGQFEQLSKEEYLCDLFTRCRVRLLTEKINSHFTYASFNLFEEQVNGGLREVCEATYEGVPYSSLNHGMKVNIGLDIINAFATQKGFAPPIFVDNAESVTRLLPTEGQQIKLVVSESDKTLRIESAKQLTGASF